MSGMVVPVPFLVALVLAAPPVPAPPARPDSAYRVLDRIAATVGDEIVLESQVERLVRLRYREKLAGESESAYRDRILDELVVDLLRERQLRQTGGLDPLPALVDEAYQSLAARTLRETGRPLAERLAEAGVKESEVRTWIRHGIALDTYARERLAPQVKVTDQDVKEYYDGPFREEAARAGLEKVPDFENAPLDVKDRARDAVRERKLNVAIAEWTQKLRDGTRVVIYRR